MDSLTYPCYKCKINIYIYIICCKICISGLTIKQFKRICRDTESVWYCIHLTGVDIPLSVASIKFLVWNIKV